MEYKNLDITFSYIEAEYITEFTEFEGYGVVTFCNESTEFLIKYISENDGHNFDPIEDYIHSEEGLQIHDTDAALRLMYVLIREKINARITMSYVHIIWMFHDLCHLHNDTREDSVYVDKFAEEQAIRASLAMCVENKIQIPYEILCKTVDMFNTRFKSRELTLEELLDCFPQSTLTLENATCQSLINDDYY